MAGISRALRQDILDHLLKTTAWVQPTNLYVALYTAAPSATGGGTEVSEASYARILHNTWNAATAAEPSIATNNGIVTFDEALTDWGTIVAAAIFDALTVGTFIAYGTFTGKPISTGDVARFKDTDLSMQLNET